MKFQNQVTSLKLSKRLKELGYPQESLHFWAVEMSKGRETDKWSLCPKEHLLSEHPKYSAPTVAELGEMLPAHQCSFGKSELVTNGFVQIAYGKWCGSWTDNNGTYVDFAEEKEADLRAKMMIYLLENKLVKL